MSLLDEIIEGAVDEQSNLAAVLRKCKVLASQLGSKPLEDWLLWESAGYPNDVSPPAYRSINFSVHAIIVVGMMIHKQHLVSPSSLPKEYQKLFTSFECRSSISYLEKQLSTKKDMHSFTFDGMGGIVRQSLGEGVICLNVWGEYSTLQVVEVINAVRDRILDFALALKKEIPEASEIAKISPERVSTIYETHIWGNAHVGNLTGELQMGDNYKVGQAGAVGPQSHAHNMSFNQIWNENADNIDLEQLSGELAKLKSVLQERASDPEHHAAIGNVAAAEQAAANGNGPKALEFLKNAGKWALDTAKDIGVGVASTAITVAMGMGG